MKKLLLTLFSFISFSVSYADVTRGPLQQHPALCQYGYNPNCGQNTPPSQKIIRYVDVYVPSKYGALAGDKKTAILRDFANADSLTEAKKKALELCSQEEGAKNCKIITWVRNGCIAASGGKLKGKLTLFHAVKIPGEAEQASMNSCKKAGTSNCQIIVPEVCSVPEGMYQ